MGAKKAPQRCCHNKDILIKALIHVRNSLLKPKLSIIPAERCTFDYRFLYSALLLSVVVLHGKPSFHKSFISFYFGNEYMVTQSLRFGKPSFRCRHV